jgi:hypothetical protein
LWIVNYSIRRQIECAVGRVRNAREYTITPCECKVGCTHAWNSRLGDITYSNTMN